MINIKTAINLLKKNRRAFLYAVFDKLNKQGLLKWLNDSTFIRMDYRLRLGKKLNLKYPKTFNEKLQWLKLHDRRPEYITMVDKIAVKDYVAEKVGKEYIIPTLGVWESPEDIDWESLPNQFVLKWNHDSGSIIICKDKSTFDYKAAIEKLSYGAKVNGFWYGREWPYKGVMPMLLAEKYMEDSKSHDLCDYKFFCFNGHVKFFKVDFNRFTNHRANYYDSKGDLLPFGETICPPDFSADLTLPNNLSLMVSLAEKLSETIPFLRVDFYDINGRVYFGEMTFYPASGHGSFEPEEWDLAIGNWLDLSSQK